VIGDIVVAGAAAAGTGGAAGAGGLRPDAGAGGRGAFNVFDSGANGSAGLNGLLGLPGFDGPDGQVIRGLRAADGTVTEIANDFIVYVRARSETVAEGEAVTFSIIAAGDTGTFSVDWSVSGEGITEDDVVGGLSGTAVFPAQGDSPELFAVTIQIAADALDEGAETLTFTLGDPNTTSDVIGGVGTRTVSVEVTDMPIPVDGPDEGGDGTGEGGEDPGGGDDGAGSGPGTPIPGEGPPSPETGAPGGPGSPLELIVGTNGPDLIRGDAAAQRIEARGGFDRVFAGGGDDVLLGQGGTDLLLGGRGRDLLFGGAGTDALSGGLGDDVLTGGRGADFFVLLLGDVGGTDMVTDFGGGDRIALDDRIVGLGSGQIERREMTAADAAAIRTTDLFAIRRDGEAQTVTILYDADGPDGPGGFAPVLVLQGVSTVGLDDFALF
jgi:Ca2+-binding RTX toxin-like protein